MKKDNPTSDAAFEGPEYERFVAWWTKFRKDAEVRPPLRAVWLYFHRDFPREAFDYEGFCTYALREHNIRPSEQFIKCLRLWNGGGSKTGSLPKDLREVITKTLESEGYSPIEGLIGLIMSLMKGDYTVGSIKKPVCPTCGESREVACDVRYPDRDCAGHTVPCPDCDPIYQRKIGDEHYSSPNERKGMRRRSIETSGVLQIESPGGLFKTKAIYAMDNEGIWRYDWRTGDRRRREVQVQGISA